MPTAPTSPAELLDLVRKSGVVPAERLAAAFPDPGSLPNEPQQAAAALVRTGVLTRFQAQQLLAGRYRGFRLGAYAILDQIGRGGMGAVYLAEHTELHRKVAIKVLVTAKDDDQKLAVERFLREARSAAALDHPNIVRIFDVCRHGDVPYLVMEFVDGETLQQILDRDGTIPYTAAADHVAQAASGLQHAYEKGFVHRDIKPGNLIRDRSGTVKILDMGLARSNTNARDKLTEQLDAGAVVGTADYIAPEQALNVPNVDVRADIYSLGATFFALITGKPPFEGNTAQKLLNHQMKTAPHLSSIDSTLPKGLAGVVAKMQAKKPGDRFQTPAEVIAALAPWLGNSSRILAGLSRTNLAIGADLTATLNDLARRSSTQLKVHSPDQDSDSSAVDPSQAADETGPIAKLETTRSPSGKMNRGKNAARVPSGSRKKAALVAVAVVLLAALGVYAAIEFGSGSKQPQPDPARETAQTPAKADPPKSDPAPKDNTPPKVAPAELNLYRLDLTAQQPFSIRSTLAVPQNNPTQKNYILLAETGPGKPPKDWSGRCYNVETQMEFFAEMAPGGMALGIRNVKGPGSAMLFTPTFAAPTGVVRLRFEYSANVRDRRFALRFKPTAPSQQAWTVANIASSGTVWRVEELVIDLKGATAGYFEFHNTDENSETAVSVRSAIVTSAPTGSAPRPTPVPPPTVVAFDGWTEGESLYSLDVAAIAPYRVTKEGAKLESGEAEKLPPGVSGRCWKATATGEFRREQFDGSPAHGLTNFTEEKSAQFAFELEKDLKLALAVGKVYRVKVSYRTMADAAGTMTVQSTDFKGVAHAKLPNAAGAWKSAAMSFERQEGLPVRLTIDNGSVGEGNVLFFRSVEVVELNPPKK